MNKDISKWALGNSKLIYFLIVVLCVGGCFAYYDMSKLEDPKISIKQALVVVIYPGASPYQMELEVVDKLEKSFRTIKNVSDIESRSMNDMALIKVAIDLTVPDSEVEQHWDFLRRKITDIQPELPAGVTVAVKDSFGDVFGMFYAMTINGFTDREAYKYAEYVKRNLQDIDGISQVEIYGVRNECVYIDLLEDRMSSLGVLPTEVIATLNGQNQTVYSGYYESGDSRIRVSVNDRYKDIQDIENLLIQGHEGDQLRLGDIARVSDGYEESPRNQMFYDDQRAIGISISAKEGMDILKLGKKVENRIAEMKESTIPNGIEFNKVFFQPERVSDSINTFIINLIESIIIVVVILMLTMGFRSGMIIGKTLLFIVLGSIAILYLFDGTLQRVSLGAFILAMGMLVDNAIVIADGILVAKQRGEPEEEALTAIGRNTAMPLLGATLIAIIAFLPPFLSPDSAGVYVRDLFIVLAVSLLLSWLLALMYVPITAKKHLKIKAENQKDPYNSAAYKALRRILGWILRHRWPTLAVSVALVLVSAYCFKYLPREFFPDMEYNQLFIEYKLPEGTSSARVQHDLIDIEQYLKSRDEVTHITMSLGGTPSRYNLVRSIANPTYSYGELIVDFTDPKILVKNIDEIQDYLSENYPEAIVRVKRYNLMYKEYPIELQFKGPDPKVLKELTAEAMSIMENEPTTRLVSRDWEQEYPEFIIDYDQPTARRLGFTRSDVGLSLLASTEGIPTGSFYEGWQDKTIYMRCIDKDGKPLTTLDNARIFGMIPPIQNISKSTIEGLMTGAISTEDLLEEATRTVPLSQATKGIKVEYVDPLIIRMNGQRAMMARCHPVSGVAAETVRQTLDAKISQITLPEGYSMEWRGEYQASADSSKNLFATVPLALILILAILIMLFKDYRRPIIIICCLPLLAVGVVFGMLISGKTFGFVAIVGCLGLMGMLIKNAVILMDEIDLQLSNGLDPTTALIESSTNRFRPVMMASMTTILGMIPLLGDCLFGSLAVTIMFGLFVGTLITLLFIPILYSLFFRFKIKGEKGSAIIGQISNKINKNKEDLI